MAGSDSAAVLQLPLDGGAGHDLHCSDGRRGAAVVAEKIVRFAMDAWTLMLCAPLPYIANTAGWMTAELGGSLADPRIDAHGAGNLAACGGGKCVVHADRVHGVVYRSGDLVAVLFYREIELGPEPGAHPRDEDAAVLAAD